MCASSRYLHAQTIFGVINAIESRLYCPKVITVSGDGTETRWHLPFLVSLGLELASEPPRRPGVSGRGGVADRTVKLRSASNNHSKPGTCPGYFAVYFYMAKARYFQTNDIGIILEHVTAHQLIRDDQLSIDKSQACLRVFLTGGNHVDILGNDAVTAFGEALGSYLKQKDIEVKPTDIELP